MAGCYGNHPEDVYYERMLNVYLADSDEIPTEVWYVCPYCGDEAETNTMCCEEMHRDEVEREIEVSDDFDEPDHKEYD